ncbi:MAG: aminotransferase class V-fold PLP-dependent enzyme [Ignavibacteriae bacterium]|nr:aminotransferase class V-fold PLP-dependent enzyme [Ignavibacteriota bacterium]
MENSIFSWDVLKTEMWWEYILNYWLSDPFTTLVLVGILFLFNSKFLKISFQTYIQFLYKPSKIDSKIDTIFLPINNIIEIFLVIVTVSVTIPLAHLCGTNVFTSYFGLITFILPVVFYVIRYILHLSKHLTAINNYTFTEISFNTASIGGEAIETTTELQYYRRKKGNIPSSEIVTNYIVRGNNESRFNGYRNIFTKLSHFISPTQQINLENRITLHNSTTDSIRYAFSKIIENNQTNCIIHSDADYESIIKIIKNDYNKCFRYEIKLHNEIIKGTFSTDYLIAELKQNISDWKGKNLSGKLIILLSHIYYKSGTSLDVCTLLGSINEISDNRIIIVLDGAQAFGNIVVDEKIMSLVHFYACCGHKWLLGKTTSGILFHCPELLIKAGINTDTIVQTNRSFSHYNYTIEDFKETIDIEPLISLSIMLDEFIKIGQDKIEKHNTYLSKYFSECLSEVYGIKIINTNYKGGIVSIYSEDAEKIRVNLLTKFNVTTQSFEKEKILRFSFHYFCGERQINQLVYYLMNSTER